MSVDPPVQVYRDDADAFAEFEVTDGTGQNVDWPSPMVAIDAAAYVSAAWQGTPAPTRRIRLAMPLALGLAPGIHTVHLKVPGGNDLPLGTVEVTDRA